MKVSLNWLKDYVDIKIDVGELGHLLTMAGLEVEAVTPVGAGFDRVIVARIDSIRRHPNADRLSLVQASTDLDKFSIVCGATNIREGQKVPLAVVGAKLPNGLEIKKSKIRGELSEGMLCSQIELGLGEEASGIMVLAPDIPLGINLGEALGLKDFVLDIGITPNRPDCLCVMGIAREVAALTRQKMRYPSLPLSSQGEGINRRTSVTVLDPDLCPRYVARMIEGVTIGPSPAWMKDRLEKVGVRSINNVVDVTNYVMMEYGQPLHAFDFELLDEGRIVVRRAKAGEEFITLDGVKRTLDDQTLMICDGIKPVALAGVMGGMNSEIKDDTKTVLLESAYFNPVNNRRTSKAIGLDTEASYRFGRGIDYGGCLAAANRAAQFIQELAGGRVLEGAIDVYPAPIRPQPVRLNVRKVNQVLGTAIPPQRMKSHLEDLELEVRGEDDGVFIVAPPSFRGDLEREIDLIEEIARMDGYEKIPTTLPAGSPSLEKREKRVLIEKRAAEVLIHHGYHEVITYSFVSPGSIDGIDLAPGDPRRRQLQLLNPLTEDFSVMRTSLVPGLLEVVRYNLSRKNSNLKIFELKKIFLPQEGEKLPLEMKQLAGIATGLDLEPNWVSPSRPVDFHDIKGCIEDLLRLFQIENVRYAHAEDVPYLHPGKAARIRAGQEAVGLLGEIHPQVASHYEIPGRAYLFELDFETVVKLAKEERRFRALPRFPAVYRDLSLVVGESLEVGTVAEAIWNFRQPYIDEVNLFDIYHGAPIPEGKKGITCRIRYQAIDRTLTDEEVNQIHQNIIVRLEDIFQVALRR
jgi:phenylalanyl-tRNA synthetase beta chain